ncbi:hypothetical protein AYJ09_04230 [Candidatus Liberibacter solanacearum]|uniref:hypothetical protein n=1 Tax=Candidatus Liberibacter solanacearum TaxID=556287 RepID=UPI0009790289|nr:hypothetical protein [Candidatus Liberibacter solanacearum]ONI59521.1 hypothetical protein AYJ09_04230 [Candidatus Liberibacter solanacearum]
MVPRQDFVKSRVKDANPHYVEKLKEHESKRQRKIDAEAKQIEEANVSKVRDYDAKGKHLESDIVLTDKERSKAVKAKEKDIKILNERIESELKLKQKASEDIIKPAEHKIGRIEKEKIKIQKSFAVNEEKLAKLAEKNKELTTQRDKTPKNLLDKRGREEYNLEHLSALKERVRQGWNDPKTKKALEKLPLIKSRLARINSEIANRKLGFDKNIAIIGEKIKPYKEEARKL